MLWGEPGIQTPWLPVCPHLFFSTSLLCTLAQSPLPSQDVSSRTPGSLPLMAAACTTDQECCCSSVNPPPLKNIHLFSHKRNLFPKVEKESHGTGWRHARHHPGAGFCLSHRGKEGTRPRPGPPQEKSKIKKKNVQIEKTTSVDRIPPLGFLQLWRLTCWVYLL